MSSRAIFLFLFLSLFIKVFSLIDYNKESLRIHEINKGKPPANPKAPVQDKEDLSIVSSPWVSEPCHQTHNKKSDAHKHTIKGRTVAIVSDGTAVLGLGDIGPEAAMPVMEGTSILFKEFGGVDAFPICLDTKNPEEIIKTVKIISPTFGGINLEDISSPRCFEIEERLKEELDIPVFHDDQHGTALVATAGIINSIKIVKKEWKDLKIVDSGAGAAGLSICRLLMKFGPGDIILINKDGIIYEGKKGLNPAEIQMSKVTNKNKIKGTIANALIGADILIGVSAGNIVNSENIKTMNRDAIVFALANPIPEIMPEEAFKGGARIVATGRSDFPNQINNVLVFPGLFRGALMVRSTKIVEEMKIAAAKALASLVSDRELNEKYIIPDVFDKRCAKVIAKEVANMAEYLNLAQNPGNREW